MTRGPERPFAPRSRIGGRPCRGRASLVGRAQQAPPNAEPATAPLNTVIPVDRAITTGRFANGLRYYIRANGKPEDRAELRLAVNAGSVLEDDDQRGLAHFVEHMAFNGTRNFPKQDIVNFVQSIGMRFGSHLNAYTSFDETVYQLQVPTDRAEVMDRAMLVLSDWAQNVTFDPVEIDKERGVVLEEWRLGRGAQGRLRDKQFPVLLAGIALRRPSADRHARGAAELQARAADPVLQGLVPAGPHGRRRRRRLRRQGRRGAREEALRVDSRRRDRSARVRRFRCRREAGTLVRHRGRRRAHARPAFRSTTRCRRAIRPRSGPTGR